MVLKENKTLPKPKAVSKSYFDQADECDCGKNLFRYHDISKNIYYKKCAYVYEEYDSKTKKWVLSKKQPCKFNISYHGERPIFAEIQKRIQSKFETKQDNLEDRLKTLFRFLFVSNHSSTIQEIDLIVKYRLKREPRKTFYFPTTTLFMKVSHQESFQEYHDRIFSQKIVEIFPPPPPPTAKQIPKKQVPKQVPKKQIPKKQIETIQSVSHFLDMPDTESEKDDNSEEGNSSDDDNNSEEDEFEDCSEHDSESVVVEETEEEIIEETYNVEEVYDDDDGDDNDYY
jgi:hypothetical protein